MNDSQDPSARRFSKQNLRKSRAPTKDEDFQRDPHRERVVFAAVFFGTILLAGIALIISGLF